MLLHVKIFGAFWMENNIAFFTKLLPCFGGFDTSSLISF